jgi:hypothetical protein
MEHTETGQPCLELRQHNDSYEPDAAWNMKGQSYSNSSVSETQPDKRNQISVTKMKLQIFGWDQQMERQSRLYLQTISFIVQYVLRFRFSIHTSLVMVCIKVLVFSYIYTPVPDDGFTEKPKTCGTSWTIKYIARKYTPDLRCVYLF